MKKTSILKTIQRKIVNKIHKLIPKYPTIRYLYNLYALGNLKILDRGLHSKYSKNYNFSRIFLRLMKNKNPVFFYDKCREFIRIIDKTKKAGFFEKLCSNKDPESSIFTVLEKIYEGEQLREKIKYAWSKNSITSEDIGLMISFLNEYPNYALDSLKSWLEPAPHFIIRKKRVIDFIEDRDGIILDIGCSFNPFLEEYMSKYFFVGIDLSFIALKIGKILTPKNLGHLVCGNAEALPFKSSCFDTIVCTEVMEHLAFPEKLLKEIYRILKSNGICVLSVPLHVVDIQNLSIEEKRQLLFHSDTTHRANFYSYNDLISLFEENNLQVISIKKDPYYIFKLQKL